MNINVATWGRLLKKNIRLASDQSDLGHDSRQGDQDGFAGEYNVVGSMLLGGCRLGSMSKPESISQGHAGR